MVYMAKKKKSVGSAKRFGTRYGKTVKQKLANVEKKAKATYECPHCGYEKVNQKSLGIWSCGKCGATFTSKAYSVRKEKRQIVKEDE